MGLFSRNFNKPGPGVQKDEPRKKGAARFFELLTRDLGDLVKLNLLFCITALPTVAMFLLAIFGFYTGITFLLSLVFAFPIGGALVACVFYITKMMRDDPSYVWHEFKRKFKENYKQAAPIGMLCTGFIYAQIWLWGSFVYNEHFQGDIFWAIAALLSLLIFGMIVPYVFLHIAYVDLKMFRILKNSVLMAFGFFPRSFMGSVLGGIIWIMFALFVPVELMFMPFPIVVLFAVSLGMLLCLMWIWPPFNKHFKVEETLVARAEEEHNEASKK